MSLSCNYCMFDYFKLLLIKHFSAILIEHPVACDQLNSNPHSLTEKKPILEYLVILLP